MPRTPAGTSSRTIAPARRSDRTRRRAAADARPSLHHRGDRAPGARHAGAAASWCSLAQPTCSAPRSGPVACTAGRAPAGHGSAPRRSWWRSPSWSRPGCCGSRRCARSSHAADPPTWRSTCTCSSSASSSSSTSQAVPRSPPGSRRRCGCSSGRWCWWATVSWGSSCRRSTGRCSTPTSPRGRRWPIERAGAQVMWVGGEFLMVALLAATMWEWMRREERSTPGRSSQLS